jgi:hypothetical protein
MKKVFKYPLVILCVYVFIVVVAIVATVINPSQGGPGLILVAILYALFSIGWIPLIIAFLIGSKKDKQNLKPKV